MAHRRTSTRVSRLDPRDETEAIRRVRGILNAAKRATGNNKERLLAEAGAVLDAVGGSNVSPVTAGRVANLKTELGFQRDRQTAVKSVDPDESAAKLEPRRVRRARRVQGQGILSRAGLSPTSRVSGVPGVGPNIETVLGAGAGAGGQSSGRAVTVRERTDPMRKAIQGAARRGGTGKAAAVGAVGALLIPAILRSMFSGDEKQQGPQVAPEVQQALLQAMQGGGGGGGINSTSRTLVDMKRVASLMQMLQSMSQVQGAGRAAQGSLVL